MRGELAGTAWISGCLLLCLAAPIAGAQGLTIALEGVPEQLGFPVPPGLNLVLTARISGGEARDVWLAEKRDARMRLHLDRVARGVYQINLGEPAVRDALGRKTAGSFRVFASDAEGRVVQSIAVRYGPRRRVHARLKPVVVGTGWTRVLGPASPWRPNWCDISKVERLEVRLEGDRVAAHAEARVGAAKFPFDTDAKTGHLVLEMTSALRTAWQNAGTLAILHQLPMKDPLRVEVRAVPERIDLPRGAKMFTLTQRAYHHFAECRGYVKLRIGDITAGQVEADLWIATQRVVTDRRLEAGDEDAGRLRRGGVGIAVRQGRHGAPLRSNRPRAARLARQAGRGLRRAGEESGCGEARHRSDRKTPERLPLKIERGPCDLQGMSSLPRATCLAEIKRRPSQSLVVVLLGMR